MNTRNYAAMLLLLMGIGTTAKAQAPFDTWNGMKKLTLTGGVTTVMRLTNIPVASNVKRIHLNNYETDYRFDDGMLAVYNKDVGKWGFYDENGNLLKGGFKWTIPSMQDKPVFHNGHVVVGSDDGWFVLDKHGNTCPLDGDNVTKIYPFSNAGIVAVQVGGLWGSMAIFNTKGQRVMSRISLPSSSLYDENPIDDIHDGLVRVKTSRGYTYLTRNGTLLPVTFSHAQLFSEGLAAVRTTTDAGARWGFINKQGKWVIQPKFSNEPTPFSSGYAVVKKGNGNMVFINKKGEVCSSEATHYTNFVNGYAFGSNHDTNVPSNQQEVWIVDSLLQRHELRSDVETIWGEMVQKLAENALPVKTVWGDRYIPEYQYYGGYREASVYDTRTGVKYEILKREISDRRIHAEVRCSIGGGPMKKWDGFLNSQGVLDIVFDSEEF